MIQEKLRATGDKIPHIYYYSQYRLETHVSALLIKFLGVKDLKIMKAILYPLFLSISIMRHYYFCYCIFIIKMVSIIAIIDSTSCFGLLIKTDFNIWWNFGMNVLPLVLLAIYFHHICNAQRNIHYYTKILVATILTFAMVALHAYDFMSVQAASCVALYMYFFGANHKGSLSELVRKLLPGICVTTVAVIIGLLLVIILHLQIVSFDNFLRNTTRRFY